MTGARRGVQQRIEEYLMCVFHGKRLAACWTGLAFATSTEELFQAVNTETMAFVTSIEGRRVVKVRE